MRKRAMSDRHFCRIFDPIPDPRGNGDVWEYEDTLAHDVHCVWTLVDGDNGDPYIVPGCHIVNKFGYMVTRNPWTDAQEADGLLVKW